VALRVKIYPGGNWPQLPTLRTQVFHLQLAVWAQDERALELLRVPAPPLRPESGRLTLGAWGNGIGVTRRDFTVDRFIEALARDRTNEAYTAWRFSAHPVHTLPIEIHAIEARLAISPTCSVWSDPRRDEVESRADHLARANFESKQRWVRFHRLRYPTKLECIFVYEGAFDAGAHGAELARWVASGLSSELDEAEVMGCVVFDRPVTHHWLDRFSAAPHAIAQLGERMEDLRPIIIGRAAVLEALAGALGAGTHLYRVAGTRLATLAIDPPTLADPAARERAQPYLVDYFVPCPGCPAEDGVMRIEGDQELYFTARRYRELDAIGAVVFARPPWVFAPLIDERYCRMLGIDPEDMVVAMMDEEVPERLRAEADRNFTALPLDQPLKERIWQAHAVALALREFGYPPRALAALLAALRARYFS
jgi:hypothetical protein